jgi:hypothetical protein
MKQIPQSKKFTIAEHSTYPADFHCPNPRGWYHSVANVEETPDGLVAVYRLSDSHTAVYTHIMVAYSTDGGRNWEGHHSISRKNAWEHHRVWVAPQLSRLRDGRLVIICDLAHRTSHDDWPPLTRWQKNPPRGMWNYLFWSDDNGKTWSDPVVCDDVGGEPGYITELGDGTLVYTRTESARSDLLKDGPLPWGEIYYRNRAVFSEDGGKSWERTSLITDAPFHGDCEVGIVELEPNHLMAATRIGFGAGQFGQPSRLVHSYDGGKTWEKPILAPFYGHRNIMHKLQSGKLLVTYRNRWGTPASYAFLWDPTERFDYQPNAFIWDESRCTMSDDAMTLATDGTREAQVIFGLYPALTGDSTVDLSATVRVAEGDASGALVSAGFLVRITPDAVFLVEDGGGKIDASGAQTVEGAGAGSKNGFASSGTEWHDYRFVRENGSVRIFVDGDLKLERPAGSHAVREVRFGSERESTNYWRSVSAKVSNPGEYSIDWTWDVTSGKFPDQFRRDRMVVLDYTGDSGYSGWTQREDGSIVIVDYTNDVIGLAGALSPQPILRAYLVEEEDLA